jgi:hypothetical protein
MSYNMVDAYVGTPANGTTITLRGGRYAIQAVASNWNSQTLDIQRLSGDGTTYVSVLDAVISGNKFQVLDLPAGTYKFVLSGVITNLAVDIVGIAVPM